MLSLVAFSAGGQLAQLSSETVYASSAEAPTIRHTEFGRSERKHKKGLVLIETRYTLGRLPLVRVVVLFLRKADAV